MADPAGHLARLRRADSQAKAARVRAALDAMAAAGEPPGVSLLARRAAVSRRFIYDHPELRAEIAHHAAQVVGQHERARNRRLEADLTTLRRRLGKVIGRDVLSEISTTDHPDIASRASQLEQDLFEAQEALARRTEELEAARQINRELMARLNREG